MEIRNSHLLLPSNIMNYMWSHVTYSYIMAVKPAYLFSTTTNRWVMHWATKLWQLWCHQVTGMFGSVIILQDHCCMCNPWLTSSLHCTQWHMLWGECSSEFRCVFLLSLPNYTPELSPEFLLSKKNEGHYTFPYPKSVRSSPSLLSFASLMESSACYGYCHKVPQTGQSKWQKFITSQQWRLKFWGQSLFPSGAVKESLFP
jgi:hypothetical protein